MKNRREYFRKIFCLILSISLTMGGVSLPTSAKELTVSTEQEFMEALSDLSIETIILNEEIMISRSADGLDNAFVIDRPVTIQGGGLRIERAGIVLGADVTFQNTSIYMANPVRNAIIANGYSLTLNNVSDGGSPYVIHLFCGGVTDYTGGNEEEVPEAGDEGKISIQGTNDLANIYAGSFSDVFAGEEDQANDFPGEALIVIENGATGFGEIFAHGAREDRLGGQANSMIASEALYTVSGGVSVYLNGQKNIHVHGATGSDQDASFIYTDNGKGYSCSPLLENIGNIALNTVKSGVKANLQPAAGSSFSKKGSVITLPADTILNLTNLADDDTKAEISGLYGGGLLVLEEQQALTIHGEVQGTTTVAIGDVNFYGDASTGYPEAGEIYLRAEHSASDSFVLLPPNYDPMMILKRNTEGIWTTEIPVDTTVISELSMEDAVAEADNFGVNIPVRVTYQSDGFDYLSYVPIRIKVNDQEAKMVGDDLYGYTYITGTTENDIELYFYEDAEGQEVLTIGDAGFRTGTVPEGVYRLSFFVPEDYMADGKSYEFSITLTVGAPTPTEAPKPTATEAPEPTATEAPEPTATEAPEPTATETPEPTATEAPEPTATEAPKPTATEAPQPTEDVTKVFTDVYGDWYKDYIQYVYDNQLMTGIKGTKRFEPNANITKAQVAQVLYNMLDKQTENSTKKVFSELIDVYSGEWYAEAIAWAYDAGIVTGDLNTKRFQPNAHVTREQLALMIFRFAKSQGYDTMQTSDLSGLLHSNQVADWSMDGVRWAVGAGLISGIEKDGYKDLAPQGTASRAQVAAILMRFCEIYQ